MTAWLAAVFGASLLGSLHCAGMCGGFVACLSGECSKLSPRLHGAYHVGRGIGYLTLGGIAGLLGAGLEQGAGAVGGAGLAAFLCGGLIVLFAVIQGARAVGWTLRLPVPKSPARWVGQILTRLRSHGPIVRGGALGLLTAFLPCGWLYAFVATAAGTGSIAGGVATMGVFWLGTVPILLGVGIGAETVLRPIRARLPLVTAGLLLCVGLGTLFGHGLPAPAPRSAAAEASIPARSVPHSETLPHQHLPPIPREAPCCDDE